MKVSHLIACCVASMILWVSLGTAVGIFLGTREEDDAFANCYVYGDGDCGPKAPWHGFVNGVRHADYQ